MKKNLKKRIVGALYGIFLEGLFESLTRLRYKFEKDYLGYCKKGCENCYKWNGYCRSGQEPTPYKKFRKKYYKF